MRNAAYLKQDEIETCSYYLNEEIKLINPEILAPLGYYATGYIFQKYDILLPLKAEFSSIYGGLFLTKDKKILPLPHPASLLYSPDFKQDLMKSYRKLQMLLDRLLKKSFFSQTCPWANKSKILSTGLPEANRIVFEKNKPKPLIRH